MTCSTRFAVHSALDLVQAAGQFVIPLAAASIIFVISRRYPTDTERWFSRWVNTTFGSRGVVVGALAVLLAGLVVFGASVFATVDGDTGCGAGMSVLGALSLLITLCGAMAAGVSWAVITQAGWVVLATFFALDVWIVFGMAMMNVKGMGNAPDAMLLLAFAMHAVCMYLTTVWAFHARNLTALAQIRAGEAGRSIGAVWVFLAAYIVVSFFHNEAGPFDSASGGAVLSALTLSALAPTMGSGYTKYREVMAETQATQAQATQAQATQAQTTRSPRL